MKISEYANKIITGDAKEILQKFPDESIDCVITSPPYWALRDYGIVTEIIWDNKEKCVHEWDNLERNHPSRGKRDGNGVYLDPKYERKGANQSTVNSNFCIKCNAWKGQLGLEPTFELYIKHLCEIFDEIKRVLKKEGTCWVNISDTYYSVSGGKFENDNLGSKDRNITKGLSRANQLKHGKELTQKNLCNIPARFSIEMQNRGWILRNEIIWHKTNCYSRPPPRERNVSHLALHAEIYYLVALRSRTEVVVSLLVELWSFLAASRASCHVNVRFSHIKPLFRSKRKSGAEIVMFYIITI